MQWLDDAVRSKAKVVVVEVGIGRNTPIVSKIPVSCYIGDLVSRMNYLSGFRLDTLHLLWQ